MRSPTGEERRLLEQASSRYQQDLASDPIGLAYVAKRGIPQEIAQRFRLGVVRQPLAGHERFTGRLAIPYVTPAGVVNMNFRCIQAHDCGQVEGHRKYLKPEGVSSNLYNVLDLKRDSVFICVAEGELDTLTLSMSDLPAVGVAGVDNWAKHFSRCLEDFEVIYAFGDGDKAGSKFSNFLARETRARPIRMPPGEDCNSIFVKEGPVALQRLLQD